MTSSAYKNLQCSIGNWIVEILGMGDVSAVRVLRTLRCLRPLRAMSRLQGIKVSAVAWAIVLTWRWRRHTNDPNPHKYD